MPRILIPVDDSATTQKTIAAVVTNRDRFPRLLTLLHVVDDQPAYRMTPDVQLEMVRDNARLAGEGLLDRYHVELAEAGLESETLLEFGNPRQVIPQTADQKGFDLLIIGRHTGGGEIRDVLFGSVANYVVHHTKCPVLLV